MLLLTRSVGCRLARGLDMRSFCYTKMYYLSQIRGPVNRSMDLTIDFNISDDQSYRNRVASRQTASDTAQKS